MKENNPEVLITSANIHQFQQAYNKATELKLEQFIFEGAPVLVSYAKYVIEYYHNEQGKGGA